MTAFILFYNPLLPSPQMFYVNTKSTVVELQISGKFN